MTEKYVGKVAHWFGGIQVAGIELTDGAVQIGDTIHVRGHTSDFTQLVKSIQIDRNPVDRAAPGDLIGIEAADHARPGDKVYRVEK